MYDDNNIFAKIISNQIASSRIYEDEYLIIIKDVNPVAPFHLLAIPKGRYKNFTDFISSASSLEIAAYYKAIGKVTNDLGLAEYRLVTNNGRSVGQSVFHFHTHIIGGKNIDKLIDQGL